MSLWKGRIGSAFHAIGPFDLDCSPDDREAARELFAERAGCEEDDVADLWSTSPSAEGEVDRMLERVQRSGLFDGA